MTPLDLVLVHPNGRDGIYQSLSALAAVETPVWAAMLASYARAKGHSVAIVDAEAEQLSPEQVGKRVAELAPLLACVVVYGHHPSASTQVMPAAGATIRAIREASFRAGDFRAAHVPHDSPAPAPIRTMLLGGHVAALPERTLQEERADYVCTGEGPVALHETLVGLKAGKTPASSGARGIAFSHGFGMCRTLDAPNVEDLDAEIPTPAYDLLPMERYRAHNWHCFGGLERAPYASLYTTLGCPFSCSFCCIQAPFRAGERLKARTSTVGPNSYRRWSPTRIGATLEGLAARGIRNIKIADEMFVLNRAHVEGVCNEILARKLDLNLWAYARTDTVKDGMPELLKAAGFNWLAFGIESGSADIRNGSDKELDDLDMRETLRKTRAAGIHVIGNFIFGLPGETLSTMEETLALATELNCEFGNFYSAMAYPGSPLYAATLRDHPDDLPATWAGYSQHGRETLPVRTAALSAAQIVAFRDHAFRVYHSSSRYLAMIERTFGWSGVSDVMAMLATAPLERAP